MTTIINIETTTYQLSELIALVRNGNEVIMQQGTKPIAKLSSFAGDEDVVVPFHFGLSQGAVTMGEDFDEELPTDFWLGDTK